jgi:hypothetical protein
LNSLIPEIDCELPIFSLGRPANVPQNLLSQIVNNTALGVELKGGCEDKNGT